MEAAGSVEVLGYGWLHITLNTLLPHCRYQPPEWLSDTLLRLLREYESGGGRLPFFNRALLVMLLSYGGVYRCLQLPVHLLSCDSTGAVQLQIMAVPDYRTKLAKAALKVQYRPPPPDVPQWDAIFQGVPFVLAADMDLRRVNAAIRVARAQGHGQIAMAALPEQAEQVLFPRFRDTGLARVFVLTADAIEVVTGRKPLPYTPPRAQFITSKGDVVDAPPIQTHRKLENRLEPKIGP